MPAVHACRAAAALPSEDYKTVKEFNTWLVGGTYMMKQNDITPPPLPKSQSSEKLKLKIDEMKRKLQEGHRKPLRDKAALKAQPADGCAQKQPTSARGARHKAEKAEAAEKAALTDKGMRPNTTEQAANLRLQLKTSLIDSLTQSNYISMFPPLFTPYDRANTMLRGWDPDMKKYYEKKTTAKKAGDALEVAKPPSVSKRPSHQGKAGRPGFYPTGSRYGGTPFCPPPPLPSTPLLARRDATCHHTRSVNAYRHFTNYRLALELDSKEAATRPAVPARPKRSPSDTEEKSSDGLQKLLRAQRSAAAVQEGDKNAAAASPSWTALGASLPHSPQPPHQQTQEADAAAAPAAAEKTAPPDP